MKANRFKNDGLVLIYVLLRSAEKTFNFKENCLFCGHTDTFDSKHQKGHRLIPVRTLEFQESIVQQCKILNNKWSEKVMSRICGVHDLPAADAMYHQICSSNFRTGKSIPLVFMSNEDEQPPSKRGRSKDSFQEEAFLKVMEDLSMNDQELTTVTDLMESMKAYLGDSGSTPYGFTHMKKRIKDYYGDDIIITEINGKHNVVTFTTAASKILHEFHHTAGKNDTTREKIRVIETAAKLIKSDIQSITQCKDFYPTSDDMSIQKAKAFIPESLATFLQVCLPENSTTKVASLGQAIMQATRPRALLCPLLLGLGVQLHHHFSSRFLIDTLNTCGFSCSYSEVQSFERSASLYQGTDIPNFTPDHVIQYVADNVDHNKITIDGHNTFHGMGMIAAITPGTTGNFRIPRSTIQTEDICLSGYIKIEYFTPSVEGIKSLLYRPLSIPHVEDPTSAIDALWKASLLLHPKRPGWSGLMQMVQKGEYPGQCSVLYLPMIDMDPNDFSCIYSTLCYVSSHAKKYNVTPIVTFDQPLWWKALQIRETVPDDSDIHSVVLCLGGFHTIMSFLGCIGHIMSGCGLQDVLEQLYASNAVTHILSGKAVERATRGHFLIDAALNTMLMSQAFNIDVTASIFLDELPQSEDKSQDNNLEKQSNELPQEYGELNKNNNQEDQSNSTRELLKKLAELYDDIMNDSLSTTDLQISPDMQKFCNISLSHKTSIMTSKNSKLWLQYMDMLDTLRKFIKAERTGNWKLHLQALHEMLPYMAASGHNLYTKSVYLYLQDMTTLQGSHPEVYAHFLKGYHVIRRSDRFWAGLSLDLAIEQILMRSVKTTGGLTRGRGMSEIQRLVWLFSRPTCLEINNTMQKFCSVSYSTSDQHKEATRTRVEKDLKDTKIVLSYLLERNPFSDDCTLRNIATGVTADDTINAEEAKAIGTSIIDSMIGKCVMEYSFKKKNQIVTMALNNAIKVSKEFINIDPQVLFQRLVAAGISNEHLPEIFCYELSSYPPALFDAKYVMKAANKPALADSIWAIIPEDAHGKLEGDHMYVIDGGALVHRIPWQKGCTYAEICKKYIDYIIQHYGRAFIVFDGYESGPTTKDNAHIRRNKEQMTEVHFTGSTVINVKKDRFLSNRKNKQSFINLLGRSLEQMGCQVSHARGDADLLIVKTTIESASHFNTVLVADDTDLLILLCFHTPTDCSHEIFFRPEPKSRTHKLPRCWNIKLTKRALGIRVCENILFGHALLGCDTTSRVFGIGKGVVLKLLKNDENFNVLAEVFNRRFVSPEEVATVGERALVNLYTGSKRTDTLDQLRLQKFSQKVSSSISCVQPQQLPPTSAAAKYHSLRVYHQVQSWRGYDLPPTDWGWKVTGSNLTPIMTNKDVAPQDLLEMVRCSCKTGCSTMRCSCRKAGLDCSAACGECRGICTNMTALSDGTDSLVDNDTSEH